jgi:two-component system, chemotaxis family, chemotaxis protein CheY
MARKWILVVDDDFRVRDLWVEALQGAGYAAVGAEDGAVALELIRDLFPDLILLDLRMPRLSGWGFLDAIRSHPRWKEIPVLVVSAFLDPDALAEADKGLRILGGVQKPVTIHELIDRVRAAVGPSPSPPPAAPSPRF